MPWFVLSQKELDRDLPKWKERVGRGGMWIIWPKNGSGVITDVQQNSVRRCGLGAGLVDYKIAAVDSTWSGLKFALRKVVGFQGMESLVLAAIGGGGSQPELEPSRYSGGFGVIPTRLSHPSLSRGACPCILGR